MKHILSVVVLCTLVVPAMAAPNFFDNFENGVQGSIWAKWSGSNQEILQSDPSHNLTPGGSKAARAVSADPAAYSAYADFGSTNGFVRAQVYVFEDFSNNGTNPAQPITNMLCLIGDTGGAVGFSADYLQVGVVPFWPTTGSKSYGSRTMATGYGTPTTTVPRKAGWTKLAIEADAGVGSQVRYYVDDVLITTGTRSAANLRWVRLGNNSKSYENFWYDNVSVTPEPASLMLLALGGIAVLRRRA